MILGMKRPHHGISAAPSVSLYSGIRPQAVQVNGASCNSLHGWVVRVAVQRETVKGPQPVLSQDWLGCQRSDPTDHKVMPLL